MVGVAKVVNSRPRSGSKRSTALVKPREATCTRSSRGSPRLAKRRARYSARPRWASTSSLRSTGSFVSENREKALSSADLSARSRATG
jgi:hypothetical protein